MSLEAMLWALHDAPVADATEKLVLQALADQAKADGCDAYVGKPTIAKVALSDPKTVQRKLATLVKRGLIKPGDQKAAAHIPLNKRPVVYDLQIPYGWFSNIKRVNADRARADRPPLTPQSRPDLSGPPIRKRRSDVGKPRVKKITEKPVESGGTVSPPTEDSQSQQGGFSVPPVDNPTGGTVSPARGDSESRQGGLRDPQPKELTRSTNPTPPSPPPGAPFEGPDSTAGGREEDHATPTPQPPSSAQPAAQEPGVSVEAIQVASAALDGAPPLPQDRAARIAARIEHVLALGLDPAALTGYLTADLRGARSRASVVEYRLRDDQLPAALFAGANLAGDTMHAWCGQCDERTRSVEYEHDGQPRVKRCACHPLATACAPF